MRQGARASLALAAPLAACAAIFAAAAAAERPAVRAVESVGFTVSDLDRSVRFFTEALDFEKQSEIELFGDAAERLHGVFALRARVARLRLGDETLELTQYLAPRGRPIPADAQSNDHTFQHVAIIVSDMERAYRRLREHRVRHVSPGPQTLPDWNPNAGGIKAFYFQDADGHALEILEFPGDKGAAKWHRETDRLFLGIDHTAIVVSDTERSLAFYRDALGLALAGESENYGIEQERLNGVFGARLRITAVRAVEGPGIEFLEYLAPSDGRPAPVDLRASDLAHWQTTLASPDLSAAEAILRRIRAHFISPGRVELNAAELDFGEGLMVRDPDGHALRLVAR